MNKTAYSLLKISIKMIRLVLLRWRYFHKFLDMMNACSNFSRLLTTLTTKNTLGKRVLRKGILLVTLHRKGIEKGYNRGRVGFCEVTLWFSSIAIVVVRTEIRKINDIKIYLVYIYARIFWFNIFLYSKIIKIYKCKGIFQRKFAKITINFFN